MNHLKRRWRRWLVALLLVALLLASGRWFLSSSYVTGRAAATLEKIYGGTVRVGAADIGMKNTVLTQVELFERGQGPNQQPWLTVDRLETDVSLWDLLDGTPPTRVVLGGVTVRLRFDAEGRLLTTLPAAPKATGPEPALPEVQLTDGRVLLVDAIGRQLVFDKVEATLKAEGTRHVLAGSGQHASWGQWTVAGTLDLARNSISATLKSDTSVHVTQAMLESLPLVPANVWREVQVEGDTPIVVTLASDGGSSVRVALTPIRTRLCVPAINLETLDTSGTVEITEDKITLRKMKGEFASGALATDVDLDFRKDGMRINFLDLAVDHVDMRALPRQWSIPPQLEGRLHATAKLQMTIAGGKVQTRGTGQGEIRQAVLGGQPTNQPIALAIADVHGATCLIGQVDLPATDLPQLAEAFEVKLPPEIKGRLSLQFRTELPLNTIGNPMTYRASGHSILTPLNLAGFALDPLTAAWAYRDGELRLRELRGHAPSGLLTGHATVRLEAPFTFQAKLYAANVDLIALDQLDAGFRPPVSIRGRLTATANLRGTLRPFVVSTTGTAAATDLNAAGWTITEAQARWHSDADKVIVDDLQARAYDGSVVGTASLPLNTKAGGTFQLHLGALDIGRLARERLGMTMRVEAKASGQLDGRLAPQVGDRPRDVSLQLDLRSPRLTVERGTAEQVALALRYRHGMVHYHLDGRALGGRLQLQGEQSVNGEPQGSGARPGHLRLQNIEAARLLDLGSDRAQPLPVRGTVDADLTFRLAGKEMSPTTRGRIFLTGMAWQDQPLASAAQADLTFDHQVLTLRDFSTSLGQGILSGKVVVNLGQPERSWFTATLDGADLAALLLPWPDLAQECQGTLALRVRGKLGREWNGTCDAVLTRAKLGGIAVNEWRMPIRWSLLPGEGRGHLEMHDSQAQVAQGNATVQLSAGWSTGLRLDSQVKFVGVDLRQTFPGMKLGNGRANGQLDISGEHMRSLDDLQATLQASLLQTQAMQLPVLRQIAPVLGFQSTSTFQSGELRARLARSVVRIERLTFYEGPLQLYVGGHVTLHGRVQLDITANTGKLTNMAAALGWRVAPSGSIPGELLAKATTALSPRLVHFHVTGTVHEPTIQVVPLPLLTEKALRFFAGL